MIKQFYFKQFNLALANKFKWFQVLLCITNNLIKPLSFVYTQLNDQTVLFQTIQFSISHLFACSLNITRFYLRYRLDPIRCYHSEPKLTWDWWQLRGNLHYPKLYHYRSLIIRLFIVISRILLGGSVTPLQRCSWCILQLQLGGLLFRRVKPNPKECPGYNAIVHLVNRF